MFKTKQVEVTKVLVTIKCTGDSERLAYTNRLIYRNQSVLHPLTGTTGGGGIGPRKSYMSSLP